MKKILVYILTCSIILTNFASFAYADDYDVVPYNNDTPTPGTNSN